MNQGPRPLFVYFSVHFLVICHLEINEKEYTKQKDTFDIMTNPSDEDQEGHLLFHLSEMGFLSIIMQQVGTLPCFKI